MDVKQDQELVEAEQPPAVEENGLPPPCRQDGLPQPPVPTIPPGQSQGGSMIDPRGMVREEEGFADRQNQFSKCRVIWGTVGATVIAVKVVAAIVLIVIFK